MKFTFTATKTTSGRAGYEVVVKLDGRPVAKIWSAGDRREALAEARVEAENYGYIDGVMG